MIAQYNILASVPLKAGSTCLRPIQTLPERVKLTNPATDAMTDFRKVNVVSVRANTSMDKANAKMIENGVRMLVALDDNEQIAGLITASDVLGEKPMRHLQQMGGTYADIMVSDIMTPQRELEVMNIQDVKNAKVGNIVATLKKANRQHGMVVSEEADGRQTVCGLFSITQIARQLGAQVQSFELARTFAEIETVISRG
jgi:CBS-domain-containing membrane protein